MPQKSILNQIGKDQGDSSCIQEQQARVCSGSKQSIKKEKKPQSLTKRRKMKVVNVQTELQSQMQPSSATFGPDSSQSKREENPFSSNSFSLLQTAQVVDKRQELNKSTTTQLERVTLPQPPPRFIQQNSLNFGLSPTINQTTKNQLPLKGPAIVANADQLSSPDFSSTFNKINLQTLKPLNTNLPHAPQHNSNSNQSNHFHTSKQSTSQNQNNTDDIIAQEPPQLPVFQNQTPKDEKNEEVSPPSNKSNAYIFRMGSGLPGLMHQVPIVAPLFETNHSLSPQHKVIHSNNSIEKKDEISQNHLIRPSSTNNSSQLPALIQQNMQNSSFLPQNSSNTNQSNFRQQQVQASLSRQDLHQQFMSKQCSWQEMNQTLNQRSNSTTNQLQHQDTNLQATGQQSSSVAHQQQLITGVVGPSQRQNSGNFLQFLGPSPAATDLMQMNRRASNQMLPILSRTNTPHEPMMLTSQENQINNLQNLANKTTTSERDLNFYVRQMPQQMSSHSSIPNQRETGGTVSGGPNSQKNAYEKEKMMSGDFGEEPSKKIGNTNLGFFKGTKPFPQMIPITSSPCNTMEIDNQQKSGSQVRQTSIISLKEPLCNQAPQFQIEYMGENQNKMHSNNSQMQKHNSNPSQINIAEQSNQKTFLKPFRHLTGGAGFQQFVQIQKQDQQLAYQPQKQKVQLIQQLQSINQQNAPNSVPQVFSNSSKETLQQKLSSGESRNTFNNMNQSGNYFHNSHQRQQDHRTTSQQHQMEQIYKSSASQQHVQPQESEAFQNRKIFVTSTSEALEFLKNRHYSNQNRSHTSSINNNEAPHSRQNMSNLN